MKYFILGVFLLITTASHANDLQFIWTANTDSTEGYRLYQDSSSNIIQDNIPVTDTTITITAPTDTNCHNYWLRAYAGKLESDNSDIAVYCPASDDPDMPIQPVNVGGFTISVIVTPN